VKMILVLLGAPGAGKGTQAAIISQRTGLSHVASGDLFRKAAQEGTELGQLAKSYMEKGLLVPDEVTIKMILQRLDVIDQDMGLILDGFPRTGDQAKALDKALAERGKAVDKAIYIEVANEELLKRLGGRWICRQCQTPYHEINSPPKVANKCDRCDGELYQRSDDNEATVKERLKVYFNQTAPILDYYEKEGKLVNVDGKQEIERIAEEIIQAVGLKNK